MSIFDYPRVNFAGRLRLNPGTANNDDYAQPGASQNLLPKSMGEYAGEAMGLMQTRTASARRFGMDDAQYLEWIQRAHEFDSPSAGKQSTIPAEWNYYGDMSSTAVDITVKGVQPGDLREWSDQERSLFDELIGAALDFHGNITDVNPEGSPPATQFFVDGLSLRSPGHDWIASTDTDRVDTSKGVGLWINFFRNVNAHADDGAGTCIHQVITGGHVGIPGFEDADGVVMRSYIYLPLLPANIPASNEAFHRMIEDWYRNHRHNPKTMQIVGTLAPYYAGEPSAMPPGRQMISRTADISTGALTNNNGGGHIALAPAVAHRRVDAHRGIDRLAIDFSGTFPDHYHPDSGLNPKYHMGAVTLRAVDHAGGSPETIAAVDYVNDHDAEGWVLEFDLTNAPQAAERLDHDGRLQLVDDKGHVILDEVDYYIVTDDLAVYTEQGGPGDRFVSQGPEQQITIGVYHRGTRLDRDTSPPIDVWEYRSAPIQSPGDAQPWPQPIRPGDTLSVVTEEAGARLLTFRAHGERNPPAEGFPPEHYGKFAYPPNFPVTWAPAISVRILPNDPDRPYDQYFVDPASDEPVGRAELSWDVVYREVLRTYALLFPAMNNKIHLADETEVRRFAAYVLVAVSKEYWKSVRYMPPTRDLSESKRRLLQAWCRKVLAEDHPDPAVPIEQARRRLLGS